MFHKHIFRKNRLFGLLFSPKLKKSFKENASWLVGRKMAITTFFFICMQCFTYHMLLSGFFLCSCATGGPTEVVLGHPGFSSSCLPAAVYQKLTLGGLAAGSQAAAELKGQRKEKLLLTKRSANVKRAHSTVASFKNVLHLGKLPTNDEQAYQASRSYCSSYPHCSLLPPIYPVRSNPGYWGCWSRKKEMQVEKELYGICGRSICSLQVLKP